MKTIEEESYDKSFGFEHDKIPKEFWEFVSSEKEKSHIDGAEFAQRWIPVEEEEISLNEYVNLKDDEGCILAFKFDSEAERTQLLRTNPATCWRPIELK